MRKVFLILIIIVTSSSCKKAEAAAKPYGSFSFYFEDPQPINDSELNSFPSKFKGLYMTQDSTFLRIEDDRILREYLFKFKIHIKEMDSLKSEYDLMDGKLITRDTKDKFDIKVVGDSIELSQKNTDVLYRLSYNQKAKRIDGNLVLNTRDSIFWEAEIVSLQNNVLRFKSIYLPEDLQKFGSVTAIKGKMLDSLSYLMKPTRKEFKSIFKIKNLGVDHEYTKVLK